MSTIRYGHSWNFLKQPLSQQKYLHKRKNRMSFGDTYRPSWTKKLYSQFLNRSVLPRVYSPLFLVEKKSGTWRPVIVIDLRDLNRFINSGCGRSKQF